MMNDFMSAGSNWTHMHLASFNASKHKEQS
jgi:hypothetical protein